MSGNNIQPAYRQAPGPFPTNGYNTAFPPSGVPPTSVTPLPAVSSQNRPTSGPSRGSGGSGGSTPAPKKKSRRNADPSAQKRRCVSTACVACRKRKSKCDGALPSCAACASVYCTECVYDPNSDHRRKGVYREKVDSMKAQNSTLQILIEAILNAAEDDVPTIVKKIRTCDSLDAVAESIMKEDFANNDDTAEDAGTVSDNAPIDPNQPAEGEFDLARKMGELRLENGSVRFIGGTSHLIYIGDSLGDNDVDSSPENSTEGALADRIESQFEAPYNTTEEAINSWTTVTTDTTLIIHLLNMYFNWHYTYFTTLSKSLFYKDFLRGRPQVQPKRTVYCTSLLVNAMLSLGCHFTGAVGAFAVPGDSRTKGDHFFAEAKRLIVENDEYEKPKLATVQALALMSVREAGCAREAKGWVYSGMSFRMAQDIGLNFDAGTGTGPSIGAPDNDGHHQMSDAEIDARRITFWGCFLFDKAWSNYLGRLPQLPKNSYSVPKYDVFPDEDAELWSPFTDSGFDVSLRQPSRTRAIGLQLSKLCEISSDLLLFFYHPNHIGRSNGKAVELKKLSELHRRLEDWRRELPVEFEPKEGQLPNVLLTHMFFHLQYIHLFRPFLKYTPKTSPLPAHVSPRRICTSNAGAISKLMRLYKKIYNLRQICNIAVYMIHSACTIHLLNLPEKTAKRNIIHGVKQLEEIAEDWLCARRTLSIISVLARKWGVELPEEASQVLQLSDEKYGTFSTADVPSPNLSVGSAAGLTGSGNSPHNQDFGNMGPDVDNPPSANMHNAVVKSEQFGSGSLAITTMPGLLEQFSQQSPTFQDFSTPGVTPEYLSGLPKANSPTSSAIGPASKQPAYPQGMGNPSAGPSVVPVSGTMPGINAWAMAPSAPQSMQGYPQQKQQLAYPPQPTSQPDMQQYNVDSPDWFLKEGVSWQHNFETWGLVQQRQQVPVSPTNPQHQQQQHQHQQQQDGAQQQPHPQQQIPRSNHHTPTSTDNNSTPISDSSFFLFRGAQGSDLDMSFDDLATTGGNLDGLGPV